jgi:hypothetical protein
MGVEMKELIRSILPVRILEAINKYRQMRQWREHSYLENSPQLVKEEVFVTYGIQNAQWVETGTYMGTTTNFLADRFAYVHSIEPGIDLFKQAVERFMGRNVKLYNDVSENVLPELLPQLSGEINFWLDGHYSAGVTFKGDKDCPVEDELNAISESLSLFSKVTILIDDVRCFLPGPDDYGDYPSIDYLVDWARKHQFNWRIVHDIFVMKNH